MNEKQQKNKKTECTLCPRECKVDRETRTGVCGEKNTIRLARAALHMWEEPCISGKSGSGTVFFSGCSLGCVYCQNGQIANGTIGKEVSGEQLAQIFLNLQEKGANNINLVTADHFVPQIIPALKRAKARGLTIPIVYNTGSYVNADTLRLLDGLVDIYLPDFKYVLKETAKRYSKAEDYKEKALEAIDEMVRQTGEPVFYRKNQKEREITAEEFNDSDGTEEILMKRGTIIRHLVLPERADESKKAIELLLKRYKDSVYISILNQYTPIKKFEEYPELNRRVTEAEYEAVVDFAIAQGIENGFLQEGEAANESFIPSFDYEGIL